MHTILFRAELLWNLLSPFVLASLFMLSFFSPFLFLLLYHFLLLHCVPSSCFTRLPLDTRLSSLATPHIPLTARLRAPTLTFLAYDRSASRTAAQSTDRQSRAWSPAHRKFRLFPLLWRMGFGIKFGGATSANQMDTVYDGRTVWHQPQIQRRCKTGGCERLHPLRTFSGTCVVKVRLWT